MKTPDCERYIEDPEAHASHLETCEECRALFAPPNIGERGIDVEALPLAPWEGAQHRSWPLVAGVTLAILAMASALFAASGTSPSMVLRSVVPSMQNLRAWLGVMQHAPVPFVAVAFIVINTLLIVLLRRAPRGLDV